MYANNRKHSIRPFYCHECAYAKYMKSFIMKKMGICLLVAMMLVLVGCSKPSSTTDTKEPQETEGTAGTDVNSDNVDDTTEEEDKVEDNAEEEVPNELSERVVASSVAVVEVLDALGIPVVGAPTSSYDLPESAANATRIGNPMSPDMEVIASLEPTIVVGVESLEATYGEEFNKLNINASFVNLNSYEGLKETITYFGELFGIEQRAEALLNTFKETEDNLAAAIEGKEGPSVLIIFGASNSFMVATETSYVGDLVKRVGGQNIMADAQSSFIPVDFEYLADKNPEYILFMSHANPEESLKAFEEEFESNAAWSHFDAVKNGNVIALETGYFGMSANLLAGEAMEKLVDLFYAN